MPRRTSRLSLTARTRTLMTYSRVGEESQFPINCYLRTEQIRPRKPTRDTEGRLRWMTYQDAPESLRSNCVQVKQFVARANIFIAITSECADFAPNVVTVNTKFPSGPCKAGVVMTSWISLIVLIEVKQ